MMAQALTGAKGGEDAQRREEVTGGYHCKAEVRLRGMLRLPGVLESGTQVVLEKNWV